MAGGPTGSRDRCRGVAAEVLGPSGRGILVQGPESDGPSDLPGLQGPTVIEIEGRELVLRESRLDLTDVPVSVHVQFERDQIDVDEPVVVLTAVD